MPEWDCAEAAAFLVVLRQLTLALGIEESARANRQVSQIRSIIVLGHLRHVEAALVSRFGEAAAHPLTQLLREPVEALGQAVAGEGAARLQLPLVVLNVAKAVDLGQLARVPRIRHVSLVREYQYQRVLQLVVDQHREKLGLRALHLRVVS